MVTRLSKSLSSPSMSPVSFTLFTVYFSPSVMLIVTKTSDLFGAIETCTESILKSR